MRSDRRDLAILEFSRAIAIDPDYGKAHYYRGVTLGMLGRLEEAHEAAITALDLSAGVPQVHELAWTTSYSLGDYELAWEQAILAHHAGSDIEDKLDTLRSVGAAPADLKARMDAPRVFLDTDGMPELSGQEAFRELIRGLRLALSRAARIGLTDGPPRADFRVVVDVDDIGDSTPRELKGTLEMYNREGKRVFRSDIRIPDLDDRNSLLTALQRPVRRLEDWLIER